MGRLSRGEIYEKFKKWNKIGIGMYFSTLLVVGAIGAMNIFNVSDKLLLLGDVFLIVYVALLVGVSVRVLGLMKRYRDDVRSR